MTLTEKIGSIMDHWPQEAIDAFLASNQESGKQRSLMTDDMREKLLAWHEAERRHRDAVERCSNADAEKERLEQEADRALQRIADFRGVVLLADGSVIAATDRYPRVFQAAGVTDLRPAAPCAACEAKDAEIERLKAEADKLASDIGDLAHDLERLKAATPAMPTVEQLAEAIKDVVAANDDYKLDRDGDTKHRTGTGYYLLTWLPHDIAELAHAALKRLSSPLPTRRLTRDDIRAASSETNKIRDERGMIVFDEVFAERLNARLSAPREIVEIPPGKRRETLKPGMQVTMVWPNGCVNRYEVIRVTDGRWASSNLCNWPFDADYRLFLGWLTAEEISSVIGAST